MTFLHRPSIHLNKTLTILKTTIYKVAQAQFLRVQFDNVVSTFSINHLDEKIITHSEPTSVMTLLNRPSIHLNKSLTILKKSFYEIAQAQFLSVKFDNVVGTFFVRHLDQKIALILNLQVL